MKKTVKKAASLLILLCFTLSVLVSIRAERMVFAEENYEVLITEAFDQSNGQTQVAGSATLDRRQSPDDDSYSLVVENRQNTWDGIDIPFEANRMQMPNRYRITIEGSIPATELVPEGSEIWLQIPSGSYPLLAQSSVSAGENFRLSAVYLWENQDYASFRVQSNEAAKDLSFAIHSYQIERDLHYQAEPIDDPSEEDLEGKENLYLFDFEDGTTQGFGPRAEVEKIEVIEGVNHSADGQNSLHVSGRESSWHGPSISIEDLIIRGQEYEISVWVKTDMTESQSIQLSTQIGEGSSASYVNIASTTVNNESDWQEIKGTFRFDSLGDGHVSLYLESPNVEASFYVDDMKIERLITDEVKADLSSIKEVYENDFLIGNAVSLHDLSGENLLHLKHHHNLLTAENGMKPDSLYDEDRNFDFTGADAFVAKAHEEGFFVHGHVLVWHQQSPSWLWSDANGNPLSREQALANMEKHIRTVVTHFGDKVISWDVVNEALDGSFENPENWRSHLRRSGWYQAIGDDYVYQAFRIAREVADEIGLEDLDLLYNDYNDDHQGKAQTMFYMIKELNEIYAAETGDSRPLVSQVGMQGHYNLNTNPENVRASIERFRELGIEIAVTELDLTTLTENTLSPDEEARQALLYAKLFTIYQENADLISRVTFWGLHDARSWRSERFPLPFDARLNAKAAYYGIIDPLAYIEEHDTEVEVVKKRAQASFATPVLGGDKDPIWDTQVALPVSKSQTAWEGATALAKVVWDEEHLYVLMEVSDSVLDKSADAVHEQDSVEIFIDELMSGEIYYVDGVGQYRVNFENERSFNPSSVEDGVKSFTRVNGSNYEVEIAVPWKFISPAAGMEIGFDLQVNDAESGQRIAVSSWNDLSGQGYQNPSVFGILELIRNPDETESSSEGTTESSTEETSEELPDSTSGLEEETSSSSSLADDGEDETPEEIASSEIEATTKSDEEVPATGDSITKSLVALGTVIISLATVILLRRRLGFDS